MDSGSIFFPQVDNCWLKLPRYFRHCICGHTHLEHGRMRSLKEVMMDSDEHDEYDGIWWTYFYTELFNCAANQAPTIGQQVVWKRKEVEQ